MTIGIEIKNLRSIKQFSIELPFKEGIYAITGENGVGKSTLFSALAKLVSKGALMSFFSNDGNSNSEIKYKFDSRENIWIKKINWMRHESPESRDEDILFDGFFEGSIIFGSRFSDVHKSRLSKTNKITQNDLVDADNFIVKHLGLILKNDENHYQGLKKIRTKKLAERCGFDGQPYFIERGGRCFAHFFMSSGELLLIGLLHFINERIKFKLKNRIINKSLILIDEIELALHPLAQERLSIFIEDITKTYGFCIYFATHSLQIINNIKPNNIYHLQRDIESNLQVINPCYPAYATRSLYTNDGFDFVFLVEDELAKYIVDEVIRKNSLASSKLIKVLPCGGWDKVLAMHYELMNSRLAGRNCKIFSILDGDIKDECERKYPKNSKFHGLQKSYLPIQSIEKFLKMKLIDKPDAEFAKELGDTYFHSRSIDSILADYKSHESSKKDNNGKNLFRIVEKCAEDQGISEDIFKFQICSFIYKKESFITLEKYLTGLLNC